MICPFKVYNLVIFKCIHKYFLPFCKLSFMLFIHFLISYECSYSLEMMIAKRLIGHNIKNFSETRNAIFHAKMGKNVSCKYFMKRWVQ